MCIRDSFNIPLFGMHMLYNSLAIITLGYLEDMSYDYILSKLQTFKGTKRRYTVKTNGNNVFVDDYAPVSYTHLMLIVLLQALKILKILKLKLNLMGQQETIVLF